MSGKPTSAPPSTRFLLDESLVPKVAEALALVGYDFVVCEKGMKDPEVIDWCRENHAVWVHADDRARREHRVLLQATGIRTIWVYRPKSGMSAREQLRILAMSCLIFCKRREAAP